MTETYPKGTEKYPNGTTKEQWTKYYADLKKHEDYMEAKRPKEADFADIALYRKAIDAWHMELFCDAPNKPGYYRANND